MPVERADALDLPPASRRGGGAERAAVNTRTYARQTRAALDRRA
jgi:hypothetical protein